MCWTFVASEPRRSSIVSDRSPANTRVAFAASRVAGGGGQREGNGKRTVDGARPSRRIVTSATRGVPVRARVAA